MKRRVLPFLSVILLGAPSLVLTAGAVGMAGAGCGGSGGDVVAAEPAIPAPDDASTSEATPDVPSADDAGLADTSSADASDGSDASNATDSRPRPCNDLVNRSPRLPIVAVAADAPMPQGGTIEDGTYVLADARLYTGESGAAGPTGRLAEMTLRVRGSVGDTFFDGVARSALLDVQGTTIRATTTCPSTSINEVRFTASATELTVFMDETSGTLVQTLHKL